MLAFNTRVDWCFVWNVNNATYSPEEVINLNVMRKGKKHYIGFQCTKQVNNEKRWKYSKKRIYIALNEKNVILW